ncbi:GMC oxidoreductase [Streptomyces mirabilis]|uniref:GMC oxidoreductase n=1 Tax=Streptomyces mirabilis TaxID=68239 RepID=A0A1I2G8J0_9ACTN|nr:GMC oxidoreductase [Streptomyces mirabilis]
MLDGRRCVGAEYLDPDLIHTRTVRARREVIVSCGSIDTPKLLMLSGIGPAAHLREVGVEVVVDSAGVGKNLQDHPEGVIMWEAKQPMPTTSSQWWEAGIFYDTEPGLDRPT